MEPSLFPDLIRILITCEHGGNQIPDAYRTLFENQKELLESHRGYDPGALSIARFLSRRLGVSLYSSTTSRLVVELNRSLGHPNLFSAFTRSLPSSTKQEILQSFYHPYRQQVEKSIQREISRNHTLLHLSIHSFTPILEGIPRNTDIGLLYDPRRRDEQCLAQRWRQILVQIEPTLTIRRNYPYRGNSDGFTTHLRKHFPPHRYLGFEVEINQKHMMNPSRRQSIAEILLASLHMLIDHSE